MFHFYTTENVSKPKVKFKPKWVKSIVLYVCASDETQFWHVNSNLNSFMEIPAKTLWLSANTALRKI